MTTYHNSQGPRLSVRMQARAARSEIDSFGAWISFLVVFAAVMAVILLWQNFNDHAYSLAGNTAPHTIVSTVAQR